MAGRFDGLRDLEWRLFDDLFNGFLSLAFVHVGSNRILNPLVGQAHGYPCRGADYDMGRHLIDFDQINKATLVDSV